MHEKLGSGNNCVYSLENIKTKEFVALKEIII